jgi:hypothetical protein
VHLAGERCPRVISAGGFERIEGFKRRHEIAHPVSAFPFEISAAA